MEDLSQHTLGKSQALNFAGWNKRLGTFEGDLPATRKVVPLSLLLRVHPLPRFLILCLIIKHGEIGSVQDSVLVLHEELAHRVCFHRGKGLDARGQVHSKIRIGIKPTGQRTEVLRVASQMTSDHAQLRIAC